MHTNNNDAYNAPYEYSRFQREMGQAACRRHKRATAGNAEIK